MIIILAGMIVVVINFSLNYFNSKIIKWHMTLLTFLQGKAYDIFSTLNVS